MVDIAVHGTYEIWRLKLNCCCLIASTCVSVDVTLSEETRADLARAGCAPQVPSGWNNANRGWHSSRFLVPEGRVQADFLLATNVLHQCLFYDTVQYTLFVTQSHIHLSDLLSPFHTRWPTLSTCINGIVTLLVRGTSFIGCGSR